MDANQRLQEEHSENLIDLGLNVKGKDKAGTVRMFKNGSSDKCAEISLVLKCLEAVRDTGSNNCGLALFLAMC